MRPLTLNVILLLVAASPAAAVERPFSGRITGESFMSPTANPTIYVGGAVATGQSTHTGAFYKTTTDVFDASTGWDAGAFTMTTASGSLLTGTYEGYVLVDFTNLTFSWVLEATITGGTGRFTGATGNFEFIASGDFVITGNGSISTTYTETFEGTIDY